MNIFESRDTGVPITMIEMLELALETQVPTAAD